MVIVKPVVSRREQDEFIRFPLELYRNVSEFVPELNVSVRDLFGKKNPHRETSESIFFLAYENGKPAGRIQGIIQHAANAKWHQSRVRFTRFDSIDSQPVANALFDAVSRWAKAKGIREIVGPLGYNDLDREGLLIQGFDQESTFEEQYSFPYYVKLVESYGFVPDTEWEERRLWVPDGPLDPSIERVCNAVMAKNHFRLLHFKNIKQVVDQYGEAFFRLIDETYGDLYGTVPLTEAEKKEVISDFKLFLTPKFVRFIADSKGNLVAVGLCFPALGSIVRDSKGKITLPMLIKAWKARNHPDVLDLGLIGVSKAHQNTGVAWVILYEIMKIMKEGKVKYCETNLNLVDNKAIINNWKRFKNVLHKRRISYLKEIDG